MSTRGNDAQDAGSKWNRLYGKTGMNICRWTAPWFLRMGGYGAVVGLIKEAEANQWKSRDELKDIQWRKLKRLLEHCAHHAPYYQAMFREHGIHPEDIHGFEDFSRIPVVTKQIIQEQGDEMLAKGVKKETLASKATSGSTGDPLITYMDQQRIYHAWAYNLRFNRWAGYEWGAKVASYWTMYDTREPEDILAL